MHAGCVCVAGIHPSRTWMSVSFESVRWECMCAQTRPRFTFSSERVFGGNGVRTHDNSKGKIPSTGKILPTGASKPTTLHHEGTVSLTHYQRAIPAFSALLSRAVNCVNQDRNNYGITFFENGRALTVDASLQSTKMKNSFRERLFTRAISGISRSPSLPSLRHSEPSLPPPPLLQFTR